MLTSVPPSTGSKRQATHIPRVTPPVWTNSIMRSLAHRPDDRLPLDGDRAAPRAHGEASLTVGIRDRADVAVVGQDLRPALDIGGQGEDALPRRSHDLVQRALHGASTSRTARGVSASVAGRRSPSAEPRRRARRRPRLQASDHVLEGRRCGQEALDEPAQRALCGEGATSLGAVGRCHVATGQDGVSGGPRGSQRAMDALAGERVHEPRRVAHEQPARARGCRPRGARSGPRRGSGSAVGCRAIGRRPREVGRLPRRSARPRVCGRPCGSAMPTFSSPPWRRRQPDIEATAGVHLAVIREPVDARVVGHQPETSGESNGAIHPEQMADRRARAIGAHDPIGLQHLLAAAARVAHPRSANPRPIGDEGDEPCPFTKRSP